jgi:nitrogen fixation NifU-like protein
MNLELIYTELIMEHSKNTDNKRSIENATHHEHGHNPSCGDDIELELQIHEGIIRDAGFTGTGCAISMASTSMMIDLIKGNTVPDAYEKVKDFLALIRSEKKEEDLYDQLGDATMLSNIRNMPARVKCAVLAWHTLEELLQDT